MWLDVRQQFPATNIPKFVAAFGIYAAITHEDQIEITLSCGIAILRFRGKNYTLSSKQMVFITRDVPVDANGQPVDITVPMSESLVVKGNPYVSGYAAQSLPFVSEIAQELQRAQMLHPDFPERSKLFRLGVLSEEAGEVAKALMQHEEDGEPLDNVRTELIQTAATAIRFLVSLAHEHPELMHGAS